MFAISTKDLRRSYSSTTGLFGQHRVTREALRGVSLDVEEGELFGLLGPNGAGKTTLVKIISTVLLPTSGQVEVLGHDVVARTQAVRHRIGLVFGGERGLYSTLSGRDTLRFWAALYGLPTARARARTEHVLELVGLAKRAHERVETYSRGMKQRLHLARGLLAEPELLLLDEPTIGLDPVAANGIREIVREINRAGTTVLLTTHYMAEAQSMCHRVAFINEGEIILVDRPEVLTRTAAEVVSVEATISAGGLERLRESRVSDDVSIIEARSQGGEATVRVGGPPGSLSAILEVLARCDASTVRTTEPTLEDVYLKLLGHRGLRV